MTSMNEKDKRQFLREMLGTGESYQAMVWGTVSADAKACALFSTLPARQIAANTYCYVGMSEKNINLVLVSSMFPDRILGVMRLPFDKITAAYVKNSVVPGRKIIDLIVRERLIQIKLTSSVAGTDLKDQKEGIRKITDRLKADYR